MGGIRPEVPVGAEADAPSAGQGGLSVNLAPSHPAGLRLRNPVLMASGTFGFGDEYREIVDYASLGAIVTKTVTPLPRDGNPTPRTVETPAGMLNSIGLPNPGVDGVLEQKALIWRDLPCPVVVSIAADKPAAWTALARRFDDIPNVVALEANRSCPNGAGGLDFSADPQVAAGTVAAVLAGTGQPVIAKLSPNVSDIRPIARAVELAGAHAISLVNTIVGLVIDPERRRPFLGAGTGGVSGPAIRPIALRFVCEAAQVVALPIIGIGGVATTGDALQFLMAGASAVQVGTATFRNPLAAEQIVAGLADYLTSRALCGLPEIVGAALPDRTSAPVG
jgi:dihydroorotate dehydrogenase (NAD+) catalytic subunit